MEVEKVHSRPKEKTPHDRILRNKCIHIGQSKRGRYKKLTKNKKSKRTSRNIENSIKEFYEENSLKMREYFATTNASTISIHIYTENMLL